MNPFKDYGIKCLSDLLKTFSDEQKCIDFLEDVRWNGKPISPFYKTSQVYKCKGNKYCCRQTGKYFNVKTGTIFEGTKLKLQKWFEIIWFYCSHKGGLSSKQLERDSGLTQKTAYNILQKLRYFSGFENIHSLKNDVEIDETYVGGKNRNRHFDKKVPQAQGRSYKDKTPVLGMIERGPGGKVVAYVVPSVTANDLEPIVCSTIPPFYNVYTDEWGAYHNLSTRYYHSIVNHGRKQYVDGNAHTNTIENFWSQFKRGIIGVYRVLSRKRLQLYTNEFVLKRNTMSMKPIERSGHLINNLFSRRLTNRELLDR